MSSRRGRILRWMYRGGRPNAVARVLNRLSAKQFAAGWLSPSRAVTLEVIGRRTGKPVSFPLVATDFQGERYLVSMFGNNANWVHNLKADGGRAVLTRRTRQSVLLHEVAVSDRAPILKQFLAVAPGARPHLPLDRHAPVSDFEAIAADYPVFRIEAVSS